MQEDAVDELLGDGVRKAAQRLEPAQDKPGVQRQKLESAIDPGGRLKRLIERGAAATTSPRICSMTALLARRARLRAKIMSIPRVARELEARGAHVLLWQ